MENLKLYKKIYDVMCDSEGIEKSMTVGTGQNSYKAVSEASMLNLIKPLLKKYKLIIFPIDGTIKDNVMVWEKTDSYKGTVKNDLRAITELKVMYKIVDVESGEFEIIVGFGNGADPQDKGAGKASTYSFKNVLSKTFMLFSGEDTDNTHSDDINKDTSKNAQKPPQTAKPASNTNALATKKEINDLIGTLIVHGLTNDDLKLIMKRELGKETFKGITKEEIGKLEIVIKEIEPEVK